MKKKSGLLLGLIVVASLALLGCASVSSPACEKAEAKGRPSHACYVENQQAKHELKVSENRLKEAEYGSLKAAHQAEREEQVESEIAEVEEVLKKREAERTADALEGLEK